MNLIKSTYVVIVLSVVFTLSTTGAEKISIDDTPRRTNEWGIRPFDESAVEVTPPGFVWRPQEDARVYHLQCSRESDFSTIAYEAKRVSYNVHTPPHSFEDGRWYWRFRFTDKRGNESRWSRTRSFAIQKNAREMPLPLKDELLARIPKKHPRLFVRPERITELRRRAASDLKPNFDELVASSEKIMRNPPPTEEPALYREGIKWNSDEWRKIWWGNRTYTIRALNSAVTLAFTRLMGGNEDFGHLAKKILMECAEWDPKGATGFRYNDEAGMPYNYYFSRTYTFIHDLLSEAEREKCRQVMTVRGREMYDHLCPRHLWRPYASHSNRAWHFLGEVGIAFLDEIPEAGEWAWFAANVFSSVYPVWCDDTGGWHEGVSYWSSYIYRFTWWADVMREAMGIDAFDKPYFSQVGYYPMYLQPPGTRGGGFGDLTARRTSKDNCRVMSIFAAQANNPEWQWYVEQHGKPSNEGGYIGFIRGALPKTLAKPPSDLPASRCFQGIGQAMLNTTLENAGDNVEIIFKSSPFGTQSHGYEANNSFLLYAFGERLFIRTGRRDSYGSIHHKQWMWHTKSVNCITVNGESQGRRLASAVGEILDFHTDPVFDYVSGEASGAYDGQVDRFTRRMLFVKPETVVIFDTLAAPEPASFEWRLHAPVEMSIQGQHDILVTNGKAACKANFLWPQNLNLSQTNQFDPPPRPRIKLVEYHLTAQTPAKNKAMSFVTVLRPHRAGQSLRGEAKLVQVDGGFAVKTPHGEGEATILLQTDSGRMLTYKNLKSDVEVSATLTDSDGQVTHTFALDR